MKERKEKPKKIKSKKEKPSKMIAKRGFVINWNKYRRVIETGDDVSDVPEMFLRNLRTEGVL